MNKALFQYLYWLSLKPTMGIYSRTMLVADYPESEERNLNNHADLSHTDT